MDTDQLISHSRARFEHEAARRNLREKYQAKLTFAHNGGMFSSTPEMITFLSLYGDELIVIKDLYDNPIEVNAQQLCALMKSRHQEQMTAWLVEYTELNKNR
jgi:Tfp pilus assembly protein PilZ